MSDELLEKLISQAFSTTAKRIVFAFQGGEPTVAGLSFFRRFIELERLYKPDDITVEHTIQTNGILIDEDWADFFRENSFLVGLSMDGNISLHNANRIHIDGTDTFKQVSGVFRLLQRRSVNTNILCVVTGQLARKAQSVYQGLKKTGCRYLQFIPCLDPPNAERGKQFFSLTPQRYATFLKTLFDNWYSDWEQKDYISVRVFDDYVRVLSGAPPGSCASSGVCGQYIVVESDGSVYPCDFYTYDEWYIGNISDCSLSDLIDSSTARAFLQESTTQPSECIECKYYYVCRGGCKRDRFVHDGQLHNYYCPSFLDFFDYSIDRLEIIASMERKIRSLHYR